MDFREKYFLFSLLLLDFLAHTYVLLFSLLSMSELANTFHDGFFSSSSIPDKIKLSRRKQVGTQAPPWINSNKQTPSPSLPRLIILQSGPARPTRMRKWDRLSVRVLLYIVHIRRVPLPPNQPRSPPFISWVSFVPSSASIHRKYCCFAVSVLAAEKLLPQHSE